MALIDFYIRNQKLTKIGPKLVADSINYVNCSFTFKTPDWFGIDKWVVFSKGDEAYRVNLVEDKIPKEAGLNLGAGLWNVSLFGENSSGTERITTNSVTVEVAKSTVQDGEPLPPIALSEAEQIAAKAERAIETANEVKRKAEDGEFNGKPGEPGKDGENATPEQIAQAVENYFEENPIPGGGSGGEVTAESIEEALGYPPAKPSDIPTDNKQLKNGAGYITADDIPEIPAVPTKVSELENDAGYLKDFTEKDPTVPAWAKEPTKPSYDKSEVGLGNVANERQYSAQNPPPYPVTSVNGKSGAVQLGAGDVGARPDTWMPTAEEVEAKPASYNPTYADVGAEKAGAVDAHNVNGGAHNDIRLVLNELKSAVEAFLDIDNPTFDQLSELVQKIEANAGTIEQLTNGKVNVADIVNNLTTNVSNKPLSAAQGVVLKGLIDDLVAVANNATTTAGNAMTTANEAKTLAGTANTNANTAKTTATNASNKVDNLEERMDSGEFKGENGASVTVSSVSESTESGGTNVVTFSDGKKLNVKNGKDGKDAETTPDYVIAEARETATKVLNHQSEDCFSLAWLSDLHIGNKYKVDGVWIADETSNIEAGQGLHEMSKRAPCDMISIGGDLACGANVTSHDEELSQLDDCTEYLRPATFHTPTLYLVGNHDDAPWRATANRLTRAELFSRFGKKNLLVGAVSNDRDKGCNYGYLDFENRKMRVIYLDTHDKNGWESTNCESGATESAYMNACNVSAKQLDFLANKALDFSKKENPAEWGIVVLSHIPLNFIAGTLTYTDETSGKSYQCNVDNVITILTAYLSKGSGSITHNGETVNYDFSALTDKAYLYCCVNGHRHCYEFREYGAKKIPAITCPNTRDGNERESADGKTYTKTAGTGESCSFNVITIDRVNNKIYADNHGAGIDREFDVVIYSSYTNLVPKSTTPVAEGGQPSTQIYNGGLGYKNDVRISGVTDSTSGGSGYVATGVVPYARKADGSFGVIYIKGATLDTTKSYVRCTTIQYVASEGAKSQRQMVGGGTGNTAWSTYFTIETLSDMYYKLTPTSGAGFSFNTIGFRMSLYGRGENLIITVDEPIE